MRRPAADTRHGKYRSKEVEVNAQHVVSGSRIKVHIGVELLFRVHQLLDSARHFEPLALAAGSAQLLGHLPQVSGARIFGVINTVAEAGNFLLLSQHAPHVLHRISAGFRDALQDAEGSLVVASVTRAAKVEAFNSWSACRMSAMSKARSAVGEGFSPFSISRKLAACESEGSGSTTGLPLRMRS